MNTRKREHERNAGTSSIDRRAGLPLILLIISIAFTVGCSSPREQDQEQQEGAKEKVIQEERIQVVEKDSENRVDIYFDNNLFTSYIYPESIRKPVLFPIHTASGIAVTRGYPLQPEPWERVDHPHHIGLWLNHGNVNDLDFWNNSDAVEESRRMSYGTIYHKDIKKTRSGDDKGSLEVTASWQRQDGRTLLDEHTAFYFSGENNYRIIDRITTLTASKTHVLFKDSKEGMLGIRVIRALEHPAEGPIKVLDENLEPVMVSPEADDRSRGLYENSEGLKGESVWGKRARWVKLAGEFQGKKIGIVMMDHPENPNHPAHWHARGYGLFAVNPFGSREYTDGRESLNFFLPQQESVTLKYRILIYEGEEPDQSTLNEMYDSLVNSYETESSND